MFRMIRLACLAACLLVAGGAQAGYNVEATTAKNWPQVAGRVGIMPAVCPPDFDCAWLNAVVAEYFASNSQIESVDSQTMSQALLEAGTDELTEAARSEVATALNLQSFLIVVVGNAEVKTTGAVATPIGTSVFMRPTSVAQGSVEVRVISAEGKFLAKGTGFGESSFRRGKGVVGKVFGEIFYRLFPAE